MSRLPEFDPCDNQIGGTDAGQGNVISGNAYIGMTGSATHPPGAGDFPDACPR